MTNVPRRGAGRSVAADVRAPAGGPPEAARRGERPSGPPREAELRLALREGRIAVHYQPIVDLHLATVAGAEALARWEHPGRGLVMPGDFIPLAEEHGLIWDLGAQVLRRACHDAAGWAAAGHRITCTVNVAGSQLVPPFVDLVRDTLTTTGLAPRLLAIEITETTLDEEADLAVLDALRSLGVRIALDDFGVGYSSLGRLRDLPVDIVKIDRSFAHGLATSETDRQLAAGLLAMTAALGKYTIFEGVETPEALATLAGMTVDAVQGFVFSRPQPPVKFAEILRRGIGSLVERSTAVIREIFDPQALFGSDRDSPRASPPTDGVAGHGR